MKTKKWQVKSRKDNEELKVETVTRPLRLLTNGWYVTFVMNEMGEIFKSWIRRSVRNFSSLSLYPWDYRNTLLLFRTLVRGFTARRQAAAKWRNYCTSGGQGKSWALLFDFVITKRETPKIFADILWSVVVQMWCASNRCDHGAVGTTDAMLDSWERFSNPPYSLELVPWYCHVFVKPRKYLLTSAISTGRYCHRRGPGAASRIGLLCLPRGFWKISWYAVRNAWTSMLTVWENKGLMSKCNHMNCFSPLASSHL